MGRDKDISTIYQAAEEWGLESLPVEQAIARNGWFTRDTIESSLFHWKSILTRENLENFTEGYSDTDRSDLTVGIVMAGNIPLVGLHDVLCALLSGYRIKYKPSSDDEVLMDHIIGTFIAKDPGLSERIVKAERLHNIDLVIATGSNNTARYFDYYFRDVPRLIRKNMTSVAVITGDEADEEFSGIARDVFSYFGKGCRNVTAVYVPNEETLQRFLGFLDREQWVMDYHKYANNYTYHKAIWLMNQDPFYDTGTICVKEASSIHSPLGTLYLTRYSDLEEVRTSINRQKDEIQSVVGIVPDLCDTLPGNSQKPPLNWFADRVNTLDFLTGAEVKAQ